MEINMHNIILVDVIIMESVLKKNKNKAFEYCKNSAENGYDNAQLTFGYLYEKGKGAEKDLKKAFYWYNKAADNGNELAQFELGKCYLC